MKVFKIVLASALALGATAAMSDIPVWGAQSVTLEGNLAKKLFNGLSPASQYVYNKGTADELARRGLSIGEVVFIKCFDYTRKTSSSCTVEVVVEE